MTHEQLMRLTFANLIGPAFFVCDHIERKSGRVHLSDLQALDDDEREAIRGTMPREFMVRVANFMDAAERNQIAELLGPETMAKVHEVIAAFLRTTAKAKP
jgi:hypothetical protein